VSVERVRWLGTIADFTEGARRFVTVDGREIGVLRHRDTFYAFANRCPHQGGPVCEGLVFDRVTELVDEEGRLLGSRFVVEEPRLACPWHGVEFDLASGECTIEPSLRLRRYPVRVANGDVGVVVS
jgi:nitrite reductase/ring-hydroxylating ferredoxin subunit